MPPDAPSLHVEVEGAGPVVALAHGFAGSARNFGPQARALRDRWRVVRWDARGHARSDAPDDPAAYSPDTFVADVGRVLDQVGVEAAVVGGLSMGAATALGFALAHPARVRALVLASLPDGAAGGISRIALPFADAIEQRGLDAAGEMFAWGPTSGLDPRGAALVRQGFLEHPLHGLVHTLRGVLARLPSVDALAPRLASVRQPVLLIAGERDPVARAASQKVLAALPQARLVVVPDAGHVVNLERPAAFNAALREFLDVP
jgi:pimeloyl-ACP methyl ester carboxylesterase